jgi:4-hydroxybenzoate polyprenyltransferase
VLLAQVVGLAAGWAYNLGVKATPFSFLTYVVGFGILPAIVTLSSPEPVLPAPWVIAVAAVLGMAAHFANAMPDIEGDRAEGILGLPQRVGARASGIITYGVLLGGATIAFFGPGGTILVAQWIGLVVNVVIAVAGVGLVLRRPRGKTRNESPSRLTFQLIMVAALANVVMIAVAGTRILA